MPARTVTGKRTTSTRRLVRAVGVGLVAAAIATELRKPKRKRRGHGHVAGRIPYDLRRPTLERLRESVWRPRDKRVLVPQAFGVGWTVNVGRLAHRARRR